MIWVEDTQIKVGNVILPGLLKSIEVTGSSQVEEQEIEGSGSKKKQALGYEDAKVNIELILEDGIYETKYFKLQKLQNLFKKPGQEKPIVYNIVSELTAARNVTNIIFKTLASKEDSGKSRITVTLEFWEFDTMTITAKKATSKSSTSAGKTNKTTTATVQPRRSSSGYQRGTAPKLSKEKKEKKSPAADTEKADKLVKAARNTRRVAKKGNNR